MKDYNHWTYHCISLQHLQNDHSCSAQLHLMYSWGVRVQIHCTLHCPGRWVERDYFQRKLASELQPHHCIPVVCRPLWHPAHPSGHHTPCHILFHCTPPLYPLLHWCHSLIELHPVYCMHPDLHNIGYNIVRQKLGCDMAHNQLLILYNNTELVHNINKKCKINISWDDEVYSKSQHIFYPWFQLT